MHEFEYLKAIIISDYFPTKLQLTDLAVTTTAIISFFFSVSLNRFGSNLVLLARKVLLIYLDASTFNEKKGYNFGSNSYDSLVAVCSLLQ